MKNAIKRPAAPAILLWAAALASGQQPPQPVCNHQWVPNGLPYFGPPTVTCEANTPANTPFQVNASENYSGLVYPYQGNDTQCTVDTVTLDLSGQCGGTNQGQPVTCMPQIPSYSSSNVSDSVTTSFSYEVFVETGSPGDISCEYQKVVEEPTTTLSASTPGCTCPCPAPGPTLTFNPASPIISGTTTAISPPSGFSYVAGTSAYTSSNPNAVTISATTARGVAVGSSFIGSAEMVYSPTSGYVATGCSVASTVLQVTCAGSPNFECYNGTPACVQGTWACSNGDTPCITPPPSGCYENGYQWICTAGGWNCEYVSQSGTPIVIDTKGQGFHLTGVVDGVRFPFFPGKPSVQISWTDANYSNGWLVLDRNGNGKIDSGAELFGNLTPQPPSANPNGYAALAVFDDPANGGNGNA